MKRLLILLFAASSLTAFGQVPDYLISSNPVMYFDFDGNAIEGVNGDEPLLPSGDIEYVESAERHVLELNGSGAHLYHPDEGFPSFQTVSMCIEVRLDEFGSGFGADLVPILSKWESTGTQNNEWTVYETDGQIWLWWTDSFNPGRAISFTHNWTAGEWHTICFEVGARAALWIDGEFVEEKIRDEFGSSNRLFRLGDWNNFQNPSYRTFNGAIDRLAIWSSLLTDNTSQAFHLGEAIALGCTNPEACNYDNEANQEDGSCVACDVATAFCGEGTVWDPETQSCIVANPADINLDGCVQLNDLLDLLSAYGGCEAEASPWLCGDPLEYQGYDYATVQIGERCWFAENLRAVNFSNGDPIPEMLENEEWASLIEEGRCSYQNSVVNSGFNGFLYNWWAHSDARNICPNGWHTPSNHEFNGLLNSTPEGMTQAEWLADNQSWNGQNASNFTLLASGRRTDQGEYANLGERCVFWGDEVSSDFANSRSRSTSSSGFSNDVRDKNYGASIRCIQDVE